MRKRVIIPCKPEKLIEKRELSYLISSKLVLCVPGKDTYETQTVDS